MAEMIGDDEAEKIAQEILAVILRAAQGDFDRLHTIIAATLPTVVARALPGWDDESWGFTLGVFRQNVEVAVMNARELREAIEGDEA